MIIRIVGLIVVGAGLYLSYSDVALGVSIVMVGLIAQIFEKKKK